MRGSNECVSVRQTERVGDYWKFLKAMTHQTIIKELVVMKADYVVGSRPMRLGQKVVLEYTVKSIANDQLAVLCLRERK